MVRARRRSERRAMRRILLALAALAVAAPAAQAHTAQPLAGPLDQTPDPALGLVYTGLQWTAVGPCAGSYKIGGADDCTHGPDPADAGVDVRLRTSVLATPLSGPAAKVSCAGDGTSRKRVQVL